MFAKSLTSAPKTMLCPEVTASAVSLDSLLTMKTVSNRTLFISHFVFVHGVFDGPTQASYCMIPSNLADFSWNSSLHRDEKWQLSAMLCQGKHTPRTHTRTYSPISKHSDPWRPSAVCARVCLLCAQLRDRWNKCSSLSGVYVFLLQVKVHSFCSLFTTPFVTCDIWATISAFSKSLKIWCHICCRLVVLFCIWRPFTSACSPQLFCHFHFSLNPIM